MLKNYEQKRSNFETSYHKDNWGRRTGLLVLTIYKSIWGIYLSERFKDCLNIYPILKSLSFNKYTTNEKL